MRCVFEFPQLTSPNIFKVRWQWRQHGSLIDWNLSQNRSCITSLQFALSLCPAFPISPTLLLNVVATLQSSRCRQVRRVMKAACLPSEFAVKARGNDEDVTALRRKAVASKLNSILMNIDWLPLPWGKLEAQTTLAKFLFARRRLKSESSTLRLLGGCGFGLK